MSNKWSLERTIKFLELCELHPCLYDVRLDSYKNREARKSAYESIARAMKLEDFGVLDVRSKIRTLRNTYTLELAKIMRSKRSAVSDDIVRPRPAWFAAADKFFSKLVHVNETQLQEYDARLLYVNDSSTDIRQPQAPAAKDTLSISLLPPPPPAYLDKRWRDDTEDEAPSVSVKTLSNCADEFDIFGAFVATELRGLDDVTVVRSLKRKIQAAILEAYDSPVAENVVRRRQTSSPPPPPPPSYLPSVSSQIKSECSEDEQLTSVIKCSIIAADGPDESYY